MKKILLSILLLISIPHIIMAQLKSEVNECFELTSIAFRLAEAPEYINNEIQSYADETDKYFNSFKNHKLIPYLKDLREKYGISYDAVAGAAACLEEKNGKITIKPKIKIDKVDERWSEKTFQTFVILLNDFYKKTKFKKFYLQHTALYNIATSRMDSVLQDLNLDWFQSFFGKKPQTPRVIASLSNGSNNYGFKISEENKGSGAVIGSACDAQGLPTYHKKQLSIITHELFHKYANSFISDNWAQIDSSAQKIYSHFQKSTNQSSPYMNVKAIMYEWFTNLFTIMYLQENPIERFPIEYLVRQCHDQGFIWTDRSVAFMKHFQDNRSKYATINDYLHQIISFINYTADSFDHVLNEYNNRQPYIVDIFPAPESTITPDIETIEITFSGLMSESFGMDTIYDEKIVPFPLTNKHFWKNQSTFVIQLDKSKIEGNKTYGIKFNRNFFQSEKRYPMDDNYIYTLNTSNTCKQ